MMAFAARSTPRLRPEQQTAALTPTARASQRTMDSGSARRLAKAPPTWSGVSPARSPFAE